MIEKMILYLKVNFPNILKVYYKFRFFYRALYLKEPRASLIWRLKKGDRKFHKDYNLNKESILFDVGGFEGEFTDKILKEFDCKSYIFEPHPYYFKNLKEKYKNNKNVIVFQYGLGGVTENIYLTDDFESSKLSNERTNLEIQIKDITEVMKNLNIHKIDLLKLNIEGSEYNLLNRLINSGKINLVKKLIIQFHENINDADLKRNEIRNILATYLI